MNQIDILGYKVDTRTPAEIIDYLVLQIRRPTKPVRILQINPETFVSLYNNKSDRHFVSNVDIIVPNGVGVQWAATYGQLSARPRLWQSLSWIIFQRNKLKKPLSERFTSSSFTLPLVQALARQDKPVRILIAGSPKHGDIKASAATMRRLGANLKITSFDTSNFNYAKQSKLIKLAQREKPDLILLGIGYPAQEKAANLLRDKLRHGIIVTEGGTFDYDQFGGNIRRAPISWQNLGFEWLWRLLREPTRIGRQLSLIRFVNIIQKNLR